MVAYERLKTKENVKLLALKVVAVAYQRRSLTGGSKCSDLTEKVLVFWKTSRWGEVVATGGSTEFHPKIPVPSHSTTFAGLGLHFMLNFRTTSWFSKRVKRTLEASLGTMQDARIFDAFFDESLGFVSLSNCLFLVNARARVLTSTVNALNSSFTRLFPQLDLFLSNFYLV